jgi:hypothetical protein
MIKTGPDQKKFDPSSKGTPKVGELSGCSLLPPHNPPDFVDTMMSKVLCDLPLSQNQSLKSADD